MKVKDIIGLLQQCDPEAEFIVNAPFQGFESVTVLVRRPAHGGVGHRMSFEEIATVEPTNGNLTHMQGQGLDVIGVTWEAHHQQQAKPA